MVSNAAPDIAEKPRRRQTIVNFDAASLRAPFFLRCSALLIDYLLVLIFPVCGLLLGRLFGDDGARLLNGDLNNMSWLIAVIVALSNIILLPVVSGQSLGKMIVGIKIIASTGEEASFASLAIRQTVGYLLTFLTGMLGFILSVFSSKGRSLHDLLTGTVVVYADSRVRPS